METITMASNKKNNSHGLKSIERLHLVEKVTEELRNRILNNTFKSGSNLPSEYELAELLSVSRTVVREAMRNLQSQGLVQVSHGKRARVKSPDPQATIDTFITLLKRGDGTEDDLNEVRFLIEGEIAALAAERATPDDIDRLEDILIDLKNTRTVEEAIKYDMVFHKALTETTGNPIFTVLVETLRGLIYEVQRKAYEEGGVKYTAEQHYEIFIEVKRHNSRAARQVMINHIVESLTEEDWEKRGKKVVVPSFKHRK